MNFKPLLVFFLAILLLSCQSESDEYQPTDEAIIESVFGSNINLNAPASYKNLHIPDYIRFSNTGNAIDNKKAILGRILFYDKQLSTDNTISCASCHQQELGFGDNDIASLGVNGLTLRHSMRLINVGFQSETNFFWDERVNSLESQVTEPIRDHLEMGFSGEEGAPTFNDFLTKLSKIDYYKILFKEVYGDAVISEERLQESLSQFILSIQSFDSKFDEGMIATGDPGQPFPNYSVSENRGKFLFSTLPSNGGAGCFSCHAAPEFAIRGHSLNNGVIGTINNPDVFDHSNIRSPTLRDLENPIGELNGPLMHDGSFHTLLEMIDHYNEISVRNQQNIDALLLQDINVPFGQQLMLSSTDKQALIDFLKTLTGNDVYTNPKWSNPFENQ